MEYLLSPELRKQIGDLRKNYPNITKKLEKQLGLFQQNPKHPSLRIHKLKGHLENVWSVSIDRSVRLLYRHNSLGQTIFFEIGTHDQVYRK